MTNSEYLLSFEDIPESEQNSECPDYNTKLCFRFWFFNFYIDIFLACLPDAM